jgi:hypothetical protein
MQPIYPAVKDLLDLIRYAKGCISDDCYIEEGDTLPGITLTIGWNETEQIHTSANDWSYQTGDNSYTGGAYGYQHWAIVDVYRRSNAKVLVKELRHQLRELTW